MKTEIKFDMWWENQGGLLDNIKNPKDAARFAWASALRWGGATMGLCLNEIGQEQIACDKINDILRERLFENERNYKSHFNIHKQVELVSTLYPEPKLKNGEFKQLSKLEYEGLKAAITKAAKKVYPKALKEYKSVLSYGFGRSMDDSGNPFYDLVIRLHNICTTCFREYNQGYYVANCKNCGKGENQND